MSWKDNTEPLGTSWKAGAGDYISFIPDTSYVPKEPKKSSSLTKLEAAPKKSGFLSVLTSPFSSENLSNANADLIKFLQPKIQNWVKKDGGSAFTGAVNSTLLGLPKVLTEKLTGNKETAYSMAKEENPIAYTAGEIGGYLAPGIGATKSLKPVTGALTKNIGSKLGRQLLEGALVGSALDTTQGVIEGDNAKQLATRVGTGMALGAGADVGLNALGKLAPKAIQGLQNINPSELLTTSKKVTQIGRPIEGVLNPPRLFNKEPLKADLTPTIKAQNPLNAESNINALPIKNDALKGQEPTLNMEGKLKESKFKTNTMRNAEMLQSEETQKTIDNIKAMYEVKPNEQSVARATEELKRDPQAVITRIKSSEALNNAEDATAAGLITNQLRQEADQTGDFTKLKDWLETVQPKVTNTAQGLQALSTWKKLTPEGALIKAQQVVGQVNREGEKNFGKAFKKVELTTDEMKFINDSMKNIENMADGREKDIEFAKVKKVIEEKIPSTLRDKVNSIRNISLLLNSKTMARNVVGNLLTGVGDTVSNTLSATLLRPLDNLMAKTTGIKTTALPSLSIQAKGFSKGIKETLSDSIGGLKSSELKGKPVKEKAKLIIDSLSNPINTDTISNNKFEVSKTSAFKSKPMKILENALSTSLSIGDRPFNQAYYDDVINQLKKANKVETVTEEMQNIAKKVAQERTYQDTNTITDMAMGIKNLPQKIQDHPRLKEAMQIFVDSIFPYTKTPTAILKRGLEFSPEGIIEGVAKLGVAAKNGNLTPELQREILDRISRGITGTGLIAGGMTLYDKGLLTGAANKDKDVADFETQIGKQPFSVKLGDKNYSYSQYQPLSMALGVGAQISQNKGKGIDPVTTLANAGSNALEYYSDQPMLQSIQRLAGSSNSSKGIGQRLIDAGLELPKQFVPTLGKQIAQVKDDTQRSTYSPNYLEGQLTNPIKAKIPGLTNTLDPKVDTLGNEVKQFQSDNSLFNIFVNPGYTTTENATPAQKLILDTYNETGDKTIFPRVADKSITYKNNKYDLTSKEYTEFQKEIGTKTNTLVSSNIDKLEQMTPENRAKLLQSLLSKVYDEGKKKILEQRGVNVEK
jgi:hypothetical protein